MKKILHGFKKGAASFYIVSIATLILLIIAVSFAAVIISEVTRTSNDDLSQSAYDSAMAGIEDAKLAFANYRKCIESGATNSSNSLTASSNISCSDIIYWMDHPDCDQVAHILGRIGKFDSSEVPVSDTVAVSGGKVSSDLNQAYTCVQMESKLSDYRATLTSGDPSKVVRVDLKNQGGAAAIQYVRIKWFTNREGYQLDTSNNFVTAKSRGVVFQPKSAMGGKASVPPVLQVQLIQTAKNFALSDFDASVQDSATDRATLVLVPTGNSSLAQAGKEDINYFRQWQANSKTGRNWISKGKVVHSNERNKKNVPYLVYCAENTLNDYACSVDIELPNVIGSGGRSDETFSFVVSLPYGQPETDFSMEYYCADGTTCSQQQVITNGIPTTQNSSKAMIGGTQVNVDSTGRANDLFRRVEVRLESTNNSFSQPLYTIQLLNNSDSGSTAEKSLTVTKEYGL